MGSDPAGLARCLPQLWRANALPEAEPQARLSGISTSESDLRSSQTVPLMGRLPAFTASQGEALEVWRRSRAFQAAPG
jgi:hypothetical protein